MKVLFAVSNENISESIIRKYQKEYKEIISSKNVYYFNAIQKELQKDNTYDRIVISEDLEPFTNNNYDAIDRFIFDKLDAISDEATNSSRSDTPIILICSDRRTQGEEMLVKLFSIGVYNAVIGNDRSIGQICNLIKKPRTKKEAKVYYRIDTDDVKYMQENENEVSEVEIQNILNHYKKLGKNEEKYAESFESIASQYNEEQLKVIANILPLNVKAVLETTSPKYQRIMTSSVSNYIKDNKNSGLSMNFIPDKSKPVEGNIIVPSAVNKNKVRKVKMEEPKEQINSDTMVASSLEEIENEIEEPKRGRGRPKKEELDQSDILAPKRRGRPKKNTVSEVNIPEVEPINLFDIPEKEQTQVEDLNTLPGFEEITSMKQENNEFNRNKYNPFEEINNHNEENNINLGNDNNYDDYNNYEISNNSNEITNTKNYDMNSDIQTLLIGNKKLISFVGTSKNGTSFLVNNIAEYISSTGINTAILDTTQNKNSYFIYTQNEEKLRNVAANSISNLQNGIAQGINVNKNLTVYTALPEENVGIENYKPILQTLIQNHDLVLIDCDFNTEFGYFAESQEIYLVQSLDVLTIQPLTAFLRDLKAKEILKQEKLRIVINKNMKVRGLTDKAIIGGMSYYNEPSMSFMTELFNKDNVPYCSIPFEEQTYSKYLEGLINCKVSLKGYSKAFMIALKNLNNMIYPLVGAKTDRRNSYAQSAQNYSSPTFSNGINDTLNQMKKNY